MRLFHITTIPATLGFLERQVGFMKSHGIDVDAVSSPGDELDRFAATEDVRVHSVAMNRSISPCADVIGILRMLRLFRRYRPDVVHAHTPKAGLLSMIAARLARVPCRIFHLHGLPHSTATGLSRLALVASTRVAIACATQVFAVSSSVAEQCAKDRLCGKAGIIVPAKGGINGVDAQAKFSAQKSTFDEFKASFGLPADSLVVGFAGRLVQDKGLCELAKAWIQIRAQFANAYLLIAGYPENRNALPSHVLESLETDPQVRILGWCGEMLRFYSAIDVLVLPTYREGLPTVILEAAAMEVPSVASRCVGCVDAVVDGVTGTLVPPGDATALAGALTEYLSNPELRKQHGIAARARVLRDFRPEDIWEATLREYRSATRFVRRRGSFATRVSKRTFDVAVSLPALIALSPLFAMVAILVRVALGSPVLFRQKRPGRFERPFTMLKFRTMRDSSDASGRPLPDSERLTRFGRLLRRSSLDELPELWNVLKGDMSLVGPRPLLSEYVDYFSEDERRRALVRPGITGWAQVHGRNLCAWDERLRRDVWYVDNFSFVLDLRILFMTLGQVVKSKDVIEDPRSMMLNLDEERRLREANA